ncbi:MAG: hypothetical protein QXQ29_06305 [Candidatus Bathyarchaeia archaeon]
MEPAVARRIDGIFTEIAQKYIIAREGLRRKYREASKALLFIHEVC